MIDRPPIAFNILLAAVRDLAKKYPERITGPGYWDWTLDAPNDIVGAALHRFGVEVKLEHNDFDVTALNWAALGFVNPLGPPLRWLALVQNFGDKGYTWGEAVAAADGEFPFIPRVVAS